MATGQKEMEGEGEFERGNSGITQKIEQARDKMAAIDKKIEESTQLLAKIDFNKGIVMASTKDFQESCVSILKKE